MAVWPNGLRVQPDISTGYGGYPGHNGTDFINFDINCAVTAGRIVYAGWNPSGAGYEVRLQGDDGNIYRYLHNLEGLLVSFDQRVIEGQGLGYQGATGDATGKHLHFEVWPDSNINNRVDPVPFMAALVGSSSAGGSSRPFPTPAQPKGNDMAGVLFHKTSSIGNPFTIYALAGTSPGTPANWIETTALELANSWAKQAGSLSTPNAVNGFSAGLTDDTWKQYKANYLTPLSIKTT